MSEPQCGYISAVSGKCLMRATWLVTDLNTNTWHWACNRHRNKFPGRAVPYKPYAGD